MAIHTVKGFGIVNKAEIDVFLEFSCFFNDPVDVGNLISVTVPTSVIIFTSLSVIVSIFAYNYINNYIFVIYLYLHV